MNAPDPITELGFADEAELHRLVAAADLGTPTALLAFKRWQRDDGTKAGLLKIPGVAEAVAARQAVAQPDGDPGDERELGDPGA